MSFVETLAADRRLIILRALDDASYSANETVLRSVTQGLGHQVTREQIRADMAFLTEHGLVRLEKLPAQSGEIWIAHLLPAGQDVAQGRPHPGVARREPG
ncbi:MAG: ArsR family transcriptional regulator [Acidobacteriota bacterium]